MPSRQQKSAKKDSERYLMFGPNHILVTLMWNDGRSPGHENILRWLLNRYKTGQQNGWLLRVQHTLSVRENEKKQQKKPKKNNIYLCKRN